ncbi:hypothetical protein [Paenibacillus harenae]|nr:hypothetical protein [Paenibacillus harenae]MDQ0061807.1 hypothetical protein [Paenibacillus harenae]
MPKQSALTKRPSPAQVKSTPGAVRSGSIATAIKRFAGGRAGFAALGGQ